MTGTSINPLLRAAFLARGRDANMVTLMVPFLSLEDQPKVKYFRMYLLLNCRGLVVSRCFNSKHTFFFFFP